jgi:uncharacterized membrane protein
MALFYTAAGVNHFVHPGGYMKIMPPWLPLHEQLVLISGIAEIFFALLLLFQVTRRIAAWGIIALLIAVFPANIQMMLNYYHENNPALWIAIVRLPLQIALIWWAWLFTKRLAIK